MTPKLILSSEGTLKYVAEWPEKPSYNCDPKCDPISIQRKLCSCYNDAIEYEKRVQQTIANAIPFKNKEDEKIIRKAIKIKEEPNFKQFGWEMEPLKPYDVPENVGIEMSEAGCDNPCGEECQEHGCKDKLFAFINHGPKEETCPTCGRIKSIPNFCPDSFHLKIIVIGVGEIKESQDELWREANREARNGSLEEIIERQKAKFRIERIK